VIKRLVCHAAALSLAGALSAQSPRATNVDVPIKRVMLFSSGVGYFEHAGTVHGNGITDLRFKTTQINDILKSIVLQDQDGGRVGAITYPSQDPLAKTLRSFQVDITQNPSLAQLLNQLRGARVSLVLGTEHLAGTVLGVESRSKPAEKGAPAAETPVLNLLTGATIRAVELPSVTSLSLEDPQLQEELTRALGALVQARDQDKKPVTINFTGTGDRRVRIGYVVETPVWKTSYRLLLDDKGARGRIQGWAIVENQTESDWNDVSLSLVSGRPISFTMDLYQPLYATRPVVAQEQFAGLRPQLYGAGLTPAAADASNGAPPRTPPAQRRIGFDANGNPAMRLDEVVTTGGSAGSSVAPFDAASSVESMALTGRLGELFQYTVPDVTLARQKSAMLPIITDSVELERLSIYNRSVLASNPLNGVRIRNTTGKHLLQGPVTVIDGAGYAGDARIDNLPPGQERLLSYGIDLDVLVDMSKTSTASAIRTARIEHGVLSIQRKMEFAQNYIVENKGAKDKTIVIEHPIRLGWKLASTPAPFETTPTLYRFKLPVAAGKSATLTVKEEILTGEAFALSSTDTETLLSYATTSAIPRAVRDAIAKAVDLKRIVDNANVETQRRSQQISEITLEQSRIRENMKTIAPTTPYYTRLLEKLNEQESSIERLQKERDEWTTRREEARRQLDAYLKDLTLG
jgi:hypothetical protein